MLKVGLTGGIACGKSVVRARLAERGLATLDADAVVHELLGPGTETTRKIGERFGPGVLSPDGSVDRKALGAIVFRDEASRRALNAIVHPRVWEAIDDFFREAERRGERLAIVDAALMVETGSYRHYDRVVVVHCRAEQQIERLMKRDALSREEAEGRLRAQMPIDEKKTFGDFLVDTSGSIGETLSRTDEVAGELERIAASP